MEKPVLRVLRGERLATPPLWLMRQAGRYLPEYRELRARSGTFLDFCYAPSIAAEATLQPLRRFALDASIIFSDILVVPHALGRKVWFAEGEGPRLDPLSPEDKVSLEPTRFLDRLAPVYEAIERVKSALDPHIALFGFCGAPFTLATYMIQGQGGDRLPTRAWAYRHHEAWAELLDVLSDACALHLFEQTKAGADCLQVFESWAGDASVPLLSDAMRSTASLIARYRNLAGARAVPIIGFPRNASQRLADYVQITKVDAVSLDALASKAQIDALPAGFPVQGRLDPAALLVGGDALKAGVDESLLVCREHPHIFNLGHGVNLATPPEHVTALIKLVQGHP